MGLWFSGLGLHQLSIPRWTTHPCILLNTVQFKDAEVNVLVGGLNAKLPFLSRPVGFAVYGNAFGVAQFALAVFRNLEDLLACFYNRGLRPSGMLS